ncbi:unnamed protein product [Caretta caretta]
MTPFSFPCSTKSGERSTRTLCEHLTDVGVLQACVQLGHTEVYGMSKLRPKPPDVEFSFGHSVFEMDCADLALGHGVYRKSSGYKQNAERHVQQQNSLSGHAVWRKLPSAGGSAGNWEEFGSLGCLQQKVVEVTNAGTQMGPSNPAPKRALRILQFRNLYWHSSPLDMLECWPSVNLNLEIILLLSGAGNTGQVFASSAVRLCNLKSFEREERAKQPALLVSPRGFLGTRSLRAWQAGGLISPRCLAGSR